MFDRLILIHDTRYIHDEMYGVALDPSGNYLLLGGSGDEYDYSETNSDGWSSDVWVSYLVVLDTQVCWLWLGQLVTTLFYLTGYYFA